MTVRFDSASLTSRPLPLASPLGPGFDGVTTAPPSEPLFYQPARCASESLLKRFSDIVIALALLFVLAPLFLAIAIAIRLESPGPALFRQRRGGLHGVSFRIYKFRTMRVLEDDDSVSHATLVDRRVTPLGALLRKTSFDELPQLYNVLRGEMSLVGPRPHALAHDEFYGASVVRYAERMRVRPGLTGLAQVSGSRGEIKEPGAMLTRVNYDISYIENWSFGLDVKLLVLTAVRVPFDRRAY